MENTMKILIADDDPLTCRMLEALLPRWGYEVVTARDGNEAWQILQTENSPRMAILDWMMPGMEGAEICRRIREIPHSEMIYIILLTSKGRKEDIIEGLDAGADDYITKPFDHGELRVRTQVGKRIIALQSALAYSVKVQGALEMAGAVCHEINQPLQIISGHVELMAMNMPEDDPRNRSIRSIGQQVGRIGDITKKLMRITRYETYRYPDGKQLIDIHKSSAESG
jgi:phosphoserine phosphatase RsbU/P